MMTNTTRPFGSVRFAPAAITALMAAALSCAHLLAHHSFAMYDQSVTYVFTGVVERLNPDGAHMQIAFVPLNDNRDALVRDREGKPATWLVEMAGSAAMAREGITVNSPKGKPPAAGKHCDSVEGATAHGAGRLATPSAAWTP